MKISSKLNLIIIQINIYIKKVILVHNLGLHTKLNALKMELILYTNNKF